MFLWLADYGVAAIAEAAGLVVRMVGATKRFVAEQQDLLQVARDALESGGRPGPIARLFPRDLADGNDPFVPLRVIASAVDQLRRDPAYLETSGAEVQYRLPGGAVGDFVPAEPGAAWALNLALLSRAALPPGHPICPGLVSRELLRTLEPEEFAATLIEGAVAALEAGYAAFERSEPELTRATGLWLPCRETRGRARCGH